MVHPKIGLVGLAGEFEVGFKNTPALLERTKQVLTQNGYTVIYTPIVMYNTVTVKQVTEFFSHQEFDLFCVCLGTWSEDHHLLDLLSYFDKPVILWAYPAVETGSLCGVQQICCVLKELDKVYFYVYGDPEDIDVLDEIGIISRAVALRNKLKHVKIGTIGGRIKGMTEIGFDEFEIKDKTGVRIVNLDEDELTQAFKKTDAHQAREYWNNLRPQVGKITSSEDAGTDSIRYYLAMKSLIEFYDLTGLCVKCYPHLMGKVCLGYSLLSEEGIVCGCEGDVNGTVAMKIVYELTGQPVHNTDLLYPDLQLNTILYSHCGAGGFSIADRKENIHLAPVRLANNGVCALFPAKPGIVSLVNLVGRKETFRLSVLTGQAIECGMEFPGNPLKVKFQFNVKEINRWIATQGIGHHWMGGYGDVSKELVHFCQLNGIKFLRM